MQNIPDGWVCVERLIHLTIFFLFLFRNLPRCVHRVSHCAALWDGGWGEWAIRFAVSFYTCLSQGFVHYSLSKFVFIFFSFCLPIFFVNGNDEGSKSAFVSFSFVTPCPCVLTSFLYFRQKEKMEQRTYLTWVAYQLSKGRPRCSLFSDVNLKKKWMHPPVIVPRYTVHEKAFVLQVKNNFPVVCTE